MPRLTPKTISPALAIRVKDDLIVEAGQWLLVFDDEQIEVMTDDEVRALYDLSPPAVAKPSKDYKRGPIQHGYSVRSLVMDAGGKTLRVPGQLVRVLTALHTAGDRSLSGVVARQMSDASDRAQVSGRMTDAVALGFATKEPASGGQFYWTLTNEGRAVVRALGDAAHERKK